jgi:electron transport complex protein RnfA
MLNLLVISINAILIENFVLVKFYGCCPFLGVSKKSETALGMGMAVVFTMTIASAMTWLFNELILKPFDLEYLQTIAFIAIIATLVQIIEMFLQKSIPSLYSALGIYLPLITTNCAVLGVTINNINDGFAFSESMVSSLRCGIGFLLAMVLFAGVRQRLEDANPPESFKGLPITLVSASIVSLSFMGFAGLVEGIFGK